MPQRQQQLVRFELPELAVSNPPQWIDTSKNHRSGSEDAVIMSKVVLLYPHSGEEH